MTVLFSYKIKDILVSGAKVFLVLIKSYFFIDPVRKYVLEFFFSPIDVGGGGGMA
jgi:hypothetical protein